MKRFRIHCSCRSLRVVMVLAAALAAGAAFAADGAIPLWERTVITMPGSYVVTRDISSSSGPVLDIQVGGVSVNLNGFTLSVTAATEPVVKIASVAGVEPQPFRIANGMIEGGLHGVHALNAERKRLRLDDLTIRGASESAVRMDNVGDLEAKGIIIVETKVGFDLMGSPVDPPFHPIARISESSIRADRGIRCTGVTCALARNAVASCVTPLILEDAGGSEAEHNQFVMPGVSCGFNPQPEPPGEGILVMNSTGVSLHGNEVMGTDVGNGINHGIAFDAMSDGGEVLGNIVRDFGDDGIRVMGNTCSVRDNLVSSNGGVGLRLGGQNNVALGNKLLGNTGVGLHFEAAVGVAHVYRDNLLTGNAAGAGGPGLADAVDGGGNVE